MPDWFEPTIRLLPFAAWMFVGVGLPWALALMPGRREPVTVLAAAMALGPLGLTAVMFVLGTFGTITLGGTLIGSVLVAAVGAALAYFGRGTSPREPVKHPRLSRVEWLMIAGIVALLVVNVITTAYWPFLEYDPLWVYAYNGRLFFEEQCIPDDLGYYPQLIALSYTHMQQAWGEANDHAARAVIPWFNVAMVLAAYVLGQRAFGSRRAGLLTAVIWQFYPHVVARYGAGDLEIPLTLYMTGAAAFFIEAWRDENGRVAVLSGLLLGGALWTKPTGGALALGVILAVAGWAVMVRFRPARLWPKLRIALITGLACLPLGGVWYLRNWLLDHTAVVFPADYWHDMAQRSGQEFGWPLLIAALVAGGLIVRRRGWLSLAGLGLMLAGSLRTALNVPLLVEDDNLWLWARGDLPAAGRLSLPEALLIVIGAGLLIWAGRGVWSEWPRGRRETVLLIVALMLPYAVVWFLNFSYHYRLSFAIVPLLIALVAGLIDGWLWEWLAARRIRAWAGVAVMGAVWIMAMWAGLEFSIPYWRDGSLPDDRAKYDEGNPALMKVVHGLERYAEETGTRPVVSIPGEDRLPYFLWGWDIRNPRAPADLPTRLEDLDGADIFVDSSVLHFLLRTAGIPQDNPLLAQAAVASGYHPFNQSGPGENLEMALRPLPLNPDGSLDADDGIFRFTAYTVDLVARYSPMTPLALPEGQVIIGGFAEYVGHDVVSLDWYRGDKTFFTLYWRPTGEAPPSQDYSIYLHLYDANGTKIWQWDGEPLLGLYHTRFWQPGEALPDYWVLTIPADLPPGPATLRLGLYDAIGGERLPVTVDGQSIGDGITINTRLTIK